LIGFFNFNPVFIGQPFKRINIAVLFMLHHEADGISAAAATKTFVNLFGRRNGKRRSLFVMKRTETKIISAPFFKLYKTADHINNIEAAQNLLYGAWGDHYSLFQYYEYMISESCQVRNSELSL